MRDFNEFLIDKNIEQIAESILRNQIDSSDFCNLIIEGMQELDPESPEIYNELSAGLKNIGKTGANFVGRSFVNVGKGIGKLGIQGADALLDTNPITRWTKDGLVYAVPKIGKGLNYVGKSIRNAYNKGENEASAKNSPEYAEIVGNLKTLKSKLKDMGFDDDKISHLFSSINKEM